MITNYQKVSSYEAGQGGIKKVVLLYSGGLDTSCILHWIQEQYKAQVVALIFDVGQRVDDLAKIRAKALRHGASDAYVMDVKDEFADVYLAAAIRANGSYQGDYYISTTSRYLMAEKAVELAHKLGADAIAHGCTGKGNDQIRLEASALALDPAIKIIAPVREWGMGREEELEYAERHGIEVDQKIDFPYSSDDNMWGVTWEGGEIEDPAAIPLIEKFLRVNLVENAPAEAEFLALEYENGVPTSLNGKKHKLSELIIELNKIGGRHGVGVSYLIEDRVVGLKVRGVYELPGAHIIISGHKKLEMFVSSRKQNEFKTSVDQRWSYLAYEGLWFDPLMEDLNSYCKSANQRVCGEVTLKLHKGKVDAVAMESPHALYNGALATFMSDYSFNQNCSAGFIELYGLQMKQAMQRDKNKA